MIKSDDDLVTGLLAQADVPDINGNVFSREAIEKAVERANATGRVQQMWLAYENGRSIEDIIGMVQSLEHEDGAMYGTAKLLDTPKGKRVKDHAKVLQGAGLTMTASFGVSGRILASHEEWRPRSVWRRLWLWITFRRRMISKVKIIDEAEIDGYSLLSRRP